MRLVLLCICLLSGCATSVTPAGSTSEASSIIATSMTRPAAGKVGVTFKRDSGWMGAACAVRVFVSGAAIAELRAGQAVTVYLSPGDYIVGAQAGFICGGGDAEANMRVVEGRVIAYRIGAGQDGTLRISPTAF